MRHFIKYKWKAISLFYTWNNFITEDIWDESKWHSYYFKVRCLFLQDNMGASNIHALMYKGVS